MVELSRLLEDWRRDLASWAIPEHISAATAESPWALPRSVFARRADRLSRAPSGPSFERAWTALQPPGSVLDVGAGAGAACLPLLPRATGLTVVDSDGAMLALLAGRAQAHGVTPRCVRGSWPQAAGHVPAADVVTCHHVLYNVPDLEPFVRALTSHARRTVIAELTARHPLAPLNDLWLRFHGLARPEAPTADDLLRVLAGMGLRPGHQRWRRPAARDYASFEELTEVTRRRLCLPPERAAEVADALAEASQRPGDRDGPASPDQEVVTVWWPGSAA